MLTDAGVYRKDGQWYSRMDLSVHVGAAWTLAALEGKGFAHRTSAPPIYSALRRAVQEIKKEHGFATPTFEQSGYDAERRRYAGRPTRQRGDKIAVVELTTAWTGAWTLTVGDARPPSASARCCSAADAHSRLRLEARLLRAARVG